MFRFGKVTVAPGFWFALVGTLIVGAWDVLPTMLLAAALHEGGHLLLLALFGVDVEEMTFTAFGVEIRANTRYLSYGKDIICTLAGPAVNILAALFFARGLGAYLPAGANLLQGCFNLLPLTGLDGARALHLALCRMLDPVRADRVSWIVELSCAVAIAMVVVYLVVRHCTGGFLLVAVSGVFVSIWREFSGK